MDQILENLLLANINIYDLKNKKILKIFFILRSLKTTRNNRSSPHNQKAFPQNLIISE